MAEKPLPDLAKVDVLYVLHGRQLTLTHDFSPVRDTLSQKTSTVPLGGLAPLGSQNRSCFGTVLYIIYSSTDQTVCRTVNSVQITFKQSQLNSRSQEP
jgi:hypothetical protein